MDWAGVPANSKHRKAESIFFLVDIWEIPNIVPSTEQLPPTYSPLANAEIPKGAGGGGGEKAQLPVKAKSFEDALTIRDVVS